MDRLDLRLVEYFVTVAEELHFGRAAQRLHIAQPSLSQQVRRLEKELGVTLLERNSRSVRLTKAGETLVREGRKVLSQAGYAVRATRSAAGRRLTVGFYGSAASTLLPDVLCEFGERFPPVEVFVRELLLGSIDDVLSGRVDVAFTRLLPGQTELEVEVLTSESRLVALPLGHPLAVRRSVAFKDLAEEGFIINPAVPTAGAPPRWLAEQRRHGLPGRIAARSASIQEILTLVAAGRGVSLVPSTVAKQYQRGDVAYVLVTDADPAVVSLARCPGPPAPDVESFVRTARQVAAAREGAHVAATAATPPA